MGAVIFIEPAPQVAAGAYHDCCGVLPAGVAPLRDGSAAYSLCQFLFLVDVSAR